MVYSFRKRLRRVTSISYHGGAGTVGALTLGADPTKVPEGLCSEVHFDLKIGGELTMTGRGLICDCNGWFPKSGDCTI